MVLVARVVASTLSYGVLAAAWSHVSVEQLSQNLHRNDMTLVAFVSSDAKSQNLEPEWNIADSRSKVPLLSIDCSTEGNPCAAFGLKTYPTLRLFRRQVEETEYEGPRRAGAILQFIDRWQRPVVSQVNGSDLSSFEALDDTVFIAYLDASDEASRSAFEAAAERYRKEFTFGVVFNANTREAEHAQSPVVKCYKHLDQDMEPNSFSFDDGGGSLENFITEASRPIIGEMTPHNRQRFLDRGWPMIYIFAITESERAELRIKLRKFAKSYYDSLTAVTVDPTEFPDLPGALGLVPGRYPAGAVHQLSKDRVYPYPYGRDISSRELQQWGLDVWQGRIKPWTPPGVTTTYDDLGPTRIAKRKVSLKQFPGMIKVAGHDEL